MKRMSSLFLALMVMLSVSVTRPAKASLLVPQLGAVATAGVYIFAGAAIGGWLMEDFSYGRKLYRLASRLAWPVFGLIILDGKEGQSASFQAITAKQAKEKKLTEEELTSYNAEVDELNALSTEVAEQLAQQEDQSVQAASILWGGMVDEIDPETLAALRKLAK